MRVYGRRVSLGTPSLLSSDEDRINTTRQHVKGFYRRGWGGVGWGIKYLNPLLEKGGNERVVGEEGTSVLKDDKYFG